MSGDCGHGWGHHYDGASGPCYACLLNEAEKLVEIREYNYKHAEGRSQHGGRLVALGWARKKLADLEALIGKKKERRSACSTRRSPSSK